MSGSEFILGAGSLALTVLFFYRWYRFAGGMFLTGRHAAIPIALGALPLAALAIIARALQSMAAYDVTGLWELFYILVGLAWLYLSLELMFAFFDLSWLDDALWRNNPAAAIAVIGAGLGITLTYAGANIGDGPGWWCVFLAGGLGWVVWMGLAALADRVARVFHRITVERDVACAVRTGCYLLASGLILGRACAGDWTSYPQTIVEFADGWPVLPLAAVYILVELLVLRMQNRKQEHEHGYDQEATPAHKHLPLVASIILGATFIASSVIAVYLLPPPPENPMYDDPAYYESLYDSDDSSWYDDYDDAEQNTAEPMNPAISPEEALDMVQQIYHSDMEQMTFPRTDEERASLREIFGYDMPGWYYQNEADTLTYVALHGEQGHLQHTIVYYTGTGAKYLSYSVNDSTGEISVAAGEISQTADERNTE